MNDEGLKLLHLPDALRVPVSYVRREKEEERKRAKREKVRTER